MARALLIALLALSACAAPAGGSGAASTDQAPATVTPTPNSPTAGPTTAAIPSSGAPSSSPGVAVAPPTRVFPPGALIRATADGLRLRAGPSATWDTVGTVNEGDVLYVTQSGDPRLAPLDADGYEWYPVAHAPGYTDWPTEPPVEERIVGFVAARSETEQFVEMVPADCPADPTGTRGVADVVALTPYERVICLGDQTLTLEGTFGCPFCDSLAHPYRMEPGWLAAWALHLNILVPTWSTYPPFPGSIVLTTPPGVRAFEPADGGSIVRVTGHFNDESATTCTITPGPEASPEPVSDEAAEWYCRERFVVETWEVIGTDPAFDALVPG